MKSLFLFSCVLSAAIAFSGASAYANPFYDDSDSYYDDGIDQGYDGECDSYDDSGDCDNDDDNFQDLLDPDDDWPDRWQ